MATSTPVIEGPRFAHLEGRTSLTYSPDGKYLYTVGSNDIIRKYTVASDDEPTSIDVPNDNTALAATSTHVLSSAEDGTVSLWSSESRSLDKLLYRTTLAVHDIALSPDTTWVAVASEETVVKVVNIDAPTATLTLREQTNSNRHVSFHPSGNYLAVSCIDGVIYVYSLSSEEPELVKKVDGIIPRQGSSEASSKVAWCPDGRAFAVPTATRDIVVVDRDNWEQQRAFASGHTGDITDFAWSPNGAFLASSGKDGKIVLWESKKQTIVAKFDHKHVCRLAWHPKANSLSFATSEGRLYTLNDFVPSTLEGALKLSTRPAPLINDVGRTTTITEVRGERPRERELLDAPNPLDAFLGDLDEDDDFIIDDDGAGYAEPNVNGKRSAAHLGGFSNDAKRQAFGVWSPQIHEPFQPSSTPWRGKRRYLCLNMVGFVWTVDQDTHNTVTIEFHDRENYRNAHFTDPYLFDKACLNEHGALFSCQSDGKENPAMLRYRPHESWTNRQEWRTLLPEGEEVTSIALSENYLVACASTGYVRVYTLYGVPFRIYRQKHTPVVTCASFRDYVITMGNGPVGADGRTQLTYMLENVRRDETLQNNDTVALPPGGELKSVFISDEGDPFIYDSEGVLLILQHWREAGQARWVPILDTKILERLADGRKQESYWPIAVARDKFQCIILKGGEQYPYFPRPLLSEFDFKVPLTNKPPMTSNENDPNSSENLESAYMTASVLLSLQQDSAVNRVLDADERLAMSKRENSIDRALLQLLMMACKEADHGEKALEICGLFRQRRTLDMAVKVALKFERTVLARKIGELRDEMELDDDG